MSVAHTFDRLRDKPRGRTVAVVLVLLVLGASVIVGLSRLNVSGLASGGSPASAGPGSLAQDYSSAEGAGPTSGRDAATAPGAATAPQDGKATAPVLSPAMPRIARTAWLGVQVEDLVGATGKARLVAASAGGQVLTENVVTGSSPLGLSGVQSDKGSEAVPPVRTNEARLTLGIPTAKLDGVLEELSRLGTVSYRSAQAQDVTSEYVDVQARIAPMQDSIERVRALMTKATDLEQVVLLESELSRRQADLDSLTQRQAELERRTSTSEVTLTLWTDATASAEPGEGGFTGGLRSAWDGLLTSVTVIVTGLAALLPWLLVLGLLAWVALRVLRGRRPTATPTTTP